jgi:hypothetical protein
VSRGDRRGQIRRERDSRVCLDSGRRGDGVMRGLLRSRRYSVRRFGGQRVAVRSCRGVLVLRREGEWTCAL